MPPFFAFAISSSNEVQAFAMARCSKENLFAFVH